MQLLILGLVLKDEKHFRGPATGEVEFDVETSSPFGGDAPKEPPSPLAMAAFLGSR